MFLYFVYRASTFLFFSYVKFHNLEEFADAYQSFAKEVQDRFQSLNLQSTEEELQELQKELENPELWQGDNVEKATAIRTKAAALEKKLSAWKSLLHQIQDTSEYLEIALLEKEESFLEDLTQKYEDQKKEFDKLDLENLLIGEDDFRNAFVHIQPGAGGTESQDWAEMLYRMYLRWAEKNGFQVELIDYQEGEEAGIKSVTFLVKGPNAYGYLRAENGVHRLVRISPFDANKKRHTSFASVHVSPEISDDVQVEINEKDLRIDTYRSSGAGGQHINKTDSAVRITHLPTGIVVACQNERSQIKNRATAMKLLKARLYELAREEKAKEIEAKSGERKDISWGNQIRSYVFHPYNMVKDLRTGYETSNVQAVMDGQLDEFIDAYLRSPLNQSGN
ncbi:MAG: peptide chain release factor 2 [Candidatus Hydrogenedentota bacterium]|nr:MAG: peptide chain release factor 2 [Candidatus Hydrogenedentota bacterium]